jgi:hypothetical protein
MKNWFKKFIYTQESSKIDRQGMSKPWRSPIRRSLHVPWRLNFKASWVYCTILISTGVSTLACSNGESMKLINTKTGYVVVEFQNGQAHFHDRFLEAEMQETGILIPPSHQSQFGGKETIFLGDKQFEQAFKDVYYPLCIANLRYRWES